MYKYHNHQYMYKYNNICNKQRKGWLEKMSPNVLTIFNNAQTLLTYFLQAMNTVYELNLIICSYLLGSYQLYFFF